MLGPIGFRAPRALLTSLVRSYRLRCMPREVSLYEAKATLSALVRQVREGLSVVITVHGVPAAELRPVNNPAKDETNEDRYQELQARGVIASAAMKPADARAWPIGKRAPGALKRFLEERD